jgi:hypothetical protein
MRLNRRSENLTVSKWRVRTRRAVAVFPVKSWFDDYQARPAPTTRSRSTQSRGSHQTASEGSCAANRADPRLAPLGRFVEPDQRDLGSPARFAKIFPFPIDPNHIYNPRRLVPKEGRIAIVTDVERDAVDAGSMLDETC